MRIKKLILTTRFVRHFKKLPADLKKIALEKEAVFRSNPFDLILKTHKLRGKFSYFWAFSITHSRRVMFEFRA